MRVVTTVAEMQRFCREVRGRGKSLALVPTMGALHEGHFSLIRHAKRQCDAVAVSIFVNPAQFDSSEDLAAYPRNLEKDVERLTAYKVDVAFAPSAGEMYAEGTTISVDPGEIAAPWEGASRPGHFRGVATVVLKLFNIVRPDIAYFGQKDLQQALLVRRLIEDLNLDVRLMICPTVRETDGLAASSRNSRLTYEERCAAPALYRSLCAVQELAQGGETDTAKLRQAMLSILAAWPALQVDYAAVVEPLALKPVERATSGCVALLAARIGKTRLIDNLIIGPPGTSEDMHLQLALTARPLVAGQALVPGLEAEAVRERISKCRECAAISTIHLPPREFLAKYIKSYYPDLAQPRVGVIARDSPATPDLFLYRNPEMSNRFVSGLYELVGVRNFAEFRARFVLTDTIRCHASSPHVPDRALSYCAKHLRSELQLFPNLETVVILGDDAYLQFQRLFLERPPATIKPFDELLKLEGWAREDARVPSFGERILRIFYCHHPTFGYKRSPSIGALLA